MRISDWSSACALPIYAPELVGALAVIWTTTPWTIPANQGIAYEEDIDYVAIQVAAAVSAGPVASRWPAETILLANALLPALAGRPSFTLPADTILWYANGSALPRAIAPPLMHNIGGFFT